jgi:hypothetical protein
MQHKHTIKTANKYIKNMAKFKYSYLGATITKQNYIHKDKSRLNSGNACYHSAWILSYLKPED